MPSKVPRPCRAVGCNHTTTERCGYCEEHLHLAAGWSQGRRGASRSNGRPWRRKRDAVMSRDKHLCQTCQRGGRVTPAAEVDHIRALSDGGSNDEWNLEAICRPCHRAKTAAESARAGGGGGSKPHS